jgi:hypothetical protein
LKRCWSKEPSKRPTSGEILTTLTSNPHLICPSIDAPMASVQRDTDKSLEITSKAKKPSDMLTLKLLISSEKRNSVEECYSPMTGPLDKDHLVIDHIDEDENSDKDEKSDDDENSDEDISSAHSSPFLPPKPTYDPTLIRSVAMYRLATSAARNGDFPAQCTAAVELSDHDYNESSFKC